MTKWLSASTWAVDHDLPSGSYSWWVQTWNTTGYGEWSEQARFTIPSYAPPDVVPEAPVGVLSLAGSPTFQWQSASRANWYHIWVNRIGAGKYASAWVQAPATTWPPDVDFHGGDYRWWIAGWNADGYGPWSSGTDFTIPTMQPDAIGLLSPTGGVTRATGSVTYQWTGDDRATWYELWCGRNNELFADNWYRAADVVSGSTATASIPDHGWGDYGWWVRGWGSDGIGDWSDKGQFTCGKPDPVSGSATTLAWDDSQTAVAGWYNVWIDVDRGGGSREKERAWWFRQSQTSDLGGGNRSVDLSPALSSGDYEWSIRAWSGVYGLGPWSDTQTFSVP